MKRFSLVLLALALGACASVTKTQSMIGDSAFAPNVRQLQAGERFPSSADPTPRWNPGVFNMNVNAGVVSINQVQDYDAMIPRPSTCFRDDFKLQAMTYDDYSCATSGSAGKSLLWDEFYSTPKAGKAEALNKAILGVGKKTSQPLVDGGYFNRKPRSWNEFKAAIQRADADGAIPKGLATEILINNREGNMANLGYDGATACTVVSKTDTVPVLVSVSYPCTVQEPGVLTRTLQTITQNVTMNVHGSVLQPFEQDQVSVALSFDGRNIAVNDPQAGPFNSYTVASRTDGGNTIVDFQEAKRNLVSLPSDIVRSVSLDPLGSGLADLAIQLDLNRYASSGPADQVLMTYSVSACDIIKDWLHPLGNTCAVLGNPWKKGALVEGVPLAAVNHFRINAPNNQKVKVTYQIYRRNSKFFNSQPLSEQTTAPVRGNR
jgi:hypothetical protein